MGADLLMAERSTLGAGRGKAWREMLLVVAVTLLCLLPFAGKPLNIDDPLFVWTAQQIRQHPLDFYGFYVNWYHYPERMADVMKNPPLASYYLAAASFVVGWDDTGLHLAMLLPTVGMVLGIYVLARQLCGRPVLVALAALMTPIVWVSATSLMCDMMMVGLFVWGVVLGMRGLDRKQPGWLWLAGSLIALGAMAKYFAVSAALLLVVYGLMSTRRVGWWMVALLLPPALALTGYHFGTRSLYGHSLLLDAASYATEARATYESARLPSVVSGLAFVGGGMLLLACLLPRVMRWRSLAIVLLISVVVVLVGVQRGWWLRPEGKLRPSLRWESQLALYAAAGIALLVVMVRHVWRRREAVSVLLVLWIVGTFVFAVFLNWTLNARTILPMVPAMAVLLVREIERLHPGPALRRLWPAVVPGALVGLLVVMGDYDLACSGRDTASRVHEKYGAVTASGATIWYQGHWGFQYYMDQYGYRSLDGMSAVLKRGDLMVVPSNNNNIVAVSTGIARAVDQMRREAFDGSVTLKPTAGAGFYSTIFGPLPYSLGPSARESYLVVQITRDWSAATDTRAPASNATDGPDR